MGVTFFLALFGFASLATAMRRHHRDLFGREPSRQRRAILNAIGALGWRFPIAVCVSHGAPSRA